MVDYCAEATACVFADTEAALARMRRTAEAARCRVLSARLIDGAIDPLADTVPGAALLVELEGEAAGDPALALLDRIRQEVERGIRRCVISAPAGLIDLVVARAWHAGIAHLCEADEDERVAAITAAREGPAARLHDSARERGFAILQPVADADAASSDPRADAALIRRMIRARRLRAQFFRADLFPDPAWDMLLDLMAARLEGQKVAVSSLCIAAAVPPTTALRWLGILAEQGLVVRVADPDDGRRVHVELGEGTARALGAWLRQARALQVDTA